MKKAGLKAENAFKKPASGPAPSPNANRAPRILDLRSRLPDMSDAELNALAANGRRLAAAGTQLQRNSAEELLPLIETELAERRARKVAAQPVKTGGARRKTVSKTRPKAAPAEAMPADPDEI